MIHHQNVKSMLISVAPEAEIDKIFHESNKLLDLCDQLKAQLNQAQQNQIKLTDTLVEQAI